MFEALQQKFTKLFRTEQRKDGWQNPMTNLGVRGSRTTSTVYGRGIRLDPVTLREIYRSNGIGKRIVNLVVDDALRGFVDGDKLLLQELSRLRTKQCILEAGYKGRLYGGAMVIAFVEDGQGFEKPLNIRAVEKLVSLQVVTKNQVNWNDEDICRDSLKEYYGSPEVFTITPETHFADANNNHLRIHRSRCFIFGGNMNVDSGAFWDESVLEACFESLRNYGIVTGSSVEIVHDFIQVIMKMKGLDAMMSEGNEKALQSRIDWLDRTRSTSNLILLDGDEDSNESYEKKSSSISGLPELSDRMTEAICAVSGIPKTKLFGSSPAGMNSTGKSDLQQWYDVVRSYRSDQIEPCLNWLIEILKSQKSWKTKPNNYTWEFPSLTAPTESEWADIKKKYAEIDAIYMDRGAIDPVEVWQARHGRGEFHANIKLSRPKLDENIEIEEDNLDLFAEEQKEKDKKEDITLKI